MIIVYHVDFDIAEKLDPTLELYYRLTFRPNSEEVKEGISNGCYKKVADVNTTNLDSAYELTNNIDTSWDQNFGVTPVKIGNRSTSIGDLFQCEDKLYVVDRIGFTPLSNEIKDLFLNSQNTSNDKNNPRYKFK